MISGIVPKEIDIYFFNFDDIQRFRQKPTSPTVLVGIFRNFAQMISGTNTNNILV